jgi:ABC-type lipoprotein export system ATPase subunit
MKPIELQNLKKVYRSRRRKVVAVKDVSLRFPSKGLCFLLGESGAGKSTLLQMISLQEKPTSGKVVIGGKDMWKSHRKIRNRVKNEDFAILFQDLNLLSEFSVYDNLRLARQIQEKDISREEAKEALARFKLGEELLDEMPGNLSGGQRARVALARAFVKDFKVLVVDEPTNSLDRENAKTVMELLAEIGKDRLVIATTHDTALAEEYGNRIVRIDHGEIVSDSAPVLTETEGEDEEEKDGNQTEKRMRLPLRAVNRLAFHGAFHSIPRFIFSLISSVLALAAFMTTLSFVFYDAKATAMREYENNGIHYVYFYLDEVYDDKNEVQVDLHSFTIDDEEELQSAFGKDLIYQAYSYITERSGELNGSDKIDSALSVPNGDLSPFGFDIVGRLPQEQDEVAEVALTKYDCLLLGWLNESNKDDENALKDILKNRTYEIMYGYDKKTHEPVVESAAICGIVDTHYEPQSDPKSDLAKKVEIERESYELSEGVFFDPVIYKYVISHFSHGNVSIHLYDAFSSDPFTAADKFNAEQHRAKDGKGYLTVSCKTRLSSVLDNMTAFQKKYRDIAATVTILLTVFTFFTYVSMISSSVRALNPSVRILRSMGIPPFAASMIYVIEIELISLFCGIVSPLPYFEIIQELRKFILQHFYMTASPFSFSWLIVLISLASILVLGLVLSLIVSWIESVRKQGRYIR